MGAFFHYLTLPYLLRGIAITLEVSAGGFAGGLILGVGLAGMQISRLSVLSVVARAYAVVFRGTPIILQLVFVYDALPHVGIYLGAVSSGIVALSANEAAFVAELIRGGINGVEKGQRLGAESLGMRPRVVMKRVIAPQALRLITPGLGNEAITVVKNSSLASVISVPELTLRSEQLVAQDFAFFSVFLASGAMYLVLTTLIGLVQVWLERSLDLDLAPSRTSLTARILGNRKGSSPSSRARTDRFGMGEPLELLRDSRRGDPSSEEESGEDSAWTSPPPTIVELCEFGQAHGDEPVVEVMAAWKSYGGRDVLKGIDLLVREGEVLVLMGASGSGKSTLLRAINHLEALDSGRVFVGGAEIGFDQRGKAFKPAGVADARVRARVGMVFQQFNLLAHLSAEENIAGPLRWVRGLPAGEAKQVALRLLDWVGLADRAGSLPRHLSGGQAQRVAIARSLAMRPRLLLLDEPTSALDPELVHEVLSVIRTLADQGMTMIIVTHQLDFARNVGDRVVFMSGGQIVDDGPPAEVLSAPKHASTAQFLRLLEVAT